MASTPAVALAELPGTYNIHRLPPAGSAAAHAAITSALNQPTTLFALLKSPDELSLVCDEQITVAAPHTSGPWRALRVVGQLDFALTGILASLTAPLAQAGISVFAISSYDTDYLLVTADTAAQARQTLLSAGVEVTPLTNDL